MPTTRRRRTRPPATVTRRQVPLDQQLDLLVGWCPARTAADVLRTRFRSYAQYLALYRQVRDEMRVRFTDPDRFFAEELHLAALAHPGADVEALGATLYHEKHGG